MLLKFLFNPYKTRISSFLRISLIMSSILSYQSDTSIPIYLHQLLLEIEPPIHCLIGGPELNNVHFGDIRILAKL